MTTDHRLRHISTLPGESYLVPSRSELEPLTEHDPVTIQGRQWRLDAKSLGGELFKVSLRADA